MPVIAITEALKVAMNILALIRTANGAPISKDEFDAIVAGRNEALAKLDADIARAKAEGR